MHRHTKIALTLIGWSAFAGGLVAGHLDGWLSVSGLAVAMVGFYAGRWVAPDAERVAVLYEERKEVYGGGGGS
jgi:hypothetical protein